MNPILMAMAELARGFLAYVENEQSKMAQSQQAQAEPEPEPEPQEATQAIKVEFELPEITAPEMVKPEFEHVLIPHWQCMSVEDLAGEKWVDLNIPTRKAMISNKGRVKLWQSRSSKHESRPVIIKPHGKTVVNHCIGTLRNDESSTTPYALHSISTAKVVLLAFGERPSWADKAPNALARSVRVYRHKNNNTNDCSLSNLEWVDEKVALIVESSLLAGDKRRIAAGEDAIAANHFAPLTGDWTTKMGSGSKKPESEKLEPERVEAKAEETDFLKTPFPDLPVEEKKPDDREWVDVPHFVGFYQVAKCGAVRSLDRYIYRYGSKRITAEHPHYLTLDAINEHNKKLYRFVRGVELTPVRLNGELSVTLCRDGLSVPVPVANLLVEAFMKPAPGVPYKYEYIDGNLSNCKLSNLRLI